jgi:corrinoid protein of di/trimethylamine methyltransferase
MSTDLLAQITNSLVDGDPEATVASTKQAIAAGLEPLAIIEGGLVPGMRIVGDKYASGEFFLPNLIVSASGMKQAMALLAPELKARRQELKSAGTVVIGTVRGDIHEIGKSLVATMLAANGFEVHDLGVDVSVDAFVARVREAGANLVGLSALLTTTMHGQKDVIDALDQAGLRAQVKVMVGGAPVTKKWADDIGADGWAQDAVAAVDLASRLVARVS